jgi:hypothetical protein
MLKQDHRVTAAILSAGTVAAGTTNCDRGAALLVAASLADEVGVRLLVDSPAQRGEDEAGEHHVNYAEKVEIKDDPIVANLLTGGCTVTPLWYAAYHGLVGVAQMLLDRGADVNGAGTAGDHTLFVPNDQILHNSHRNVFVNALCRIRSLI